jgi:phosphate transport system substrate-binding protein
MLKKKEVKILSIDGINPSIENVRNGKYPYIVTIYAVTKKVNNKEKTLKDINIQKFIEWILSTEGQELVEKTGYVSLNSR